MCNFEKSSVENDKRENFDDIIDFDAIFTQNICFFDVARDVANKIDSIKINKITKRVVDEVNNEINDEITNDFENKINSLDNASLLNINKTISFDIKISKEIDLNFFS